LGGANNDQIEYCFRTPFYAKSRGSDQSDRETIRSTKLSSLMAVLKRQAAVRSKKDIMDNKIKMVRSGVHALRQSMGNSDKQNSFTPDEIHAMLATLLGESTNGLSVPLDLNKCKNTPSVNHSHVKEQNIQKSIEFVHKCSQDLVDGNIPIDKLIISKSLSSFYKNPDRIAHKVLADRIAEREPGNKPSSGDRIEHVYIVTKDTSKKGKKMLQGDRIETPNFIKEHNLQIDYSYYITNQIMKPLLQLFGLILNDIWMAQKPPKRGKMAKFNEQIKKIKLTIEDEKKCEKKISKLKDKEVVELIFSSYLRNANNKKSGNKTVTNFFTKLK
jgi:hypothetical protein